MKSFTEDSSEDYFDHKTRDDENSSFNNRLSINTFTETIDEENSDSELIPKIDYLFDKSDVDEDVIENLNKYYSSVYFVDSIILEENEKEED